MDLNSVLTDLGKLYPIVKPHWPFLVYMFFFAFTGEVSKNKLFTVDNIKRWQKQADRLWNLGGWRRVPATILLTWIRTPLEYHPAIAGFVLGLVPGIPLSPGVTYGTVSVIYCAGAGILSLSLYDVLHGARKFVWKYVLRKDGEAPDVHLPGEPSTPPPPPTEPAQ